MTKQYYVTTETRQQLRRLLAMKGDDVPVSFDFSPLVEDWGDGDLTTATWTVESGQASIDNKALAGNVASANITTSESGKSLISLSVTDGTNTKKLFLRVVSKDPELIVATSDYGLVRI